MKRTGKFIYVTIVIAFILTSCNKDDDNITHKKSENTTRKNDIDSKKHNLNLNSSDKTKKELITISSPDKTVEVSIKFSGNKNISRLYLTKNVYSETKGALPYQYSGLGQKKKDGSIKLSKQNQKEFTYKFKFKAPKKKNDIVEYQLWVTSKKGDFRNASKNNAVNDKALCKVIIKSGKDVNLKPITLKTFSVILKNSTSKDEKNSYVFSTLDGKVHKLSEDNEYTAYWDFGYYFGTYSSLQDLYHGLREYGGYFLSVNRYLSSSKYLSPTVRKKLHNKRGINHETLNYVWFNLYSRTIADFDAISKGNDLDNLLNKKGVRFLPQSKAYRIHKGFVQEFINSYGEKGIIKVTNFVPGMNGKVEFDVKIQVRSEPFIKKNQLVSAI